MTIIERTFPYFLSELCLIVLQYEIVAKILNKIINEIPATKITKTIRIYFCSFSTTFLVIINTTKVTIAQSITINPINALIKGIISTELLRYIIKTTKNIKTPIIRNGKGTKFNLTDEVVEELNVLLLFTLFDVVLLLVELFISTHCFVLRS